MSILRSQFKAKFYEILFVGCIGICLIPITEAASRLDAVTVTATKTERSIFETSESLTRIELDEIEATQVHKLSDVLRNVPGVSIGAGPRTIAEKPRIRGLGGNRVLITLDGARQNFNSGHKGRVFVDTELLKSVEVLRGPGSALYGSGALGGIIAMTTKDAADLLYPDKQYGVRLKSSWQGVNDGLIGTATAFGKLNRLGGLDVLVSGTQRETGDLRLADKEKLSDSAEAQLGGLIKLGWSLVPGHSMSFSRQYNYHRGEVPAQSDSLTSATAVLTDRETELSLDRLSYRIDPIHPLIDLHTFVYHNRQDILEKRIGTDGRLDSIDFTTSGVDIRNSSRILRTGRTHRLSYGVEYYQDEMASRKGQAPNLAFPDAISRYSGVYVQDEISFDGRSRHFVAIPGVRYDHYRSQSEFGVGGTQDESSNTALSPKLGMIFSLNKNTNLTFNYAQSFRSPNFQELYISGAHFGANNFVPNPDLKPEELKNGVEFGIKWKNSTRVVGEDGLSIEGQLSLYQNEYDNFIDSIVTTTVTTFDNISSARIRGLEWQTQLSWPGSRLKLYSTVTIARGDNLTKDQPLSGIPGHSWAMGLEKNFSHRSLSARLQATWNQRQDRVITGQPETPGYSTYDFYVNWWPVVHGIDDLQVSVALENLFDKAYTPHLASLPAVGRGAKVSASIQF